MAHLLFNLVAQSFIRPVWGVGMDSVATRSSNRIELRVIQSMATSYDAMMTVNTEGQVISIPVRSQLGAPLSVLIGSETITLRHGKLYIYDAGRTPKSTRKPTFGRIRYLAGIEVDAEAQVQFDVKLYIPSDKYITLWDMGTRGLLPREISLQVMGLQGDALWDVNEGGGLLMIEDFSFGYPIHTYGI